MGKSSGNMLLFLTAFKRFDQIEKTAFDFFKHEVCLEEENQRTEFKNCVAKAKISLMVAHVSLDRIDEAMQVHQDLSQYLTQLS